jgi:predicted transcriptional regulator
LILTISLSVVVCSFYVVMPLTPKQLMAASLIAQGFAQKDVALEMQITPRTIQRWQREEAFQQAIEKFSEQVVKISAEAVSNLVAKQTESWSDRREWLREKEWKLAELLIEKCETILRDMELHARLQNIANALEVASKLGRKSSELWGDDLNAAISLLLKYDYEVRDKTQIENED